jgi:hypothetical protein
MSATRLDITVEQGATYSLAVTVGTTYNGLTPRGSIRSAFGGNKLADFTCSVVSAGITTITLSATITAAMVSPSIYDDLREVIIGSWDLETDSSGTVVRHRQGRVTLSLEATV